MALILVGACAMAIIAVATSFGASPNSGPRDAVWGGGHFAFGFEGGTFPRDFSINEELGRFGDADGTFVYGNNGVSGSVNTPLCLAVSGNHAVIGGVNQSGLLYLWYAVDNGTPASGVRDQVTAVLGVEPGEIGLPPGFPNVCPSPDTVFGGAPLNDLTGGDIVVRDVS
jgi:hypothetical protein